MQITRITIVFSAFDRMCTKEFFNMEVEDCKQLIWKDDCNTAVFKSIKIEVGDFIVNKTTKLDSKELEVLRYDPPKGIDIDEIFRVKHKTKDNGAE